uniref:EGF-like domain-containing protein n=1 Tax=Catharus ustulatus TaxID=91951 RepID=A0A8C3TPE8_CATUS
ETNTTFLIPPGKSLFDKTPVPSGRKQRKSFCRCQQGSTKPLNTKNAFQTPSPEPSGCHHDHVDHSSAIPYLDVTSEFVTHAETETTLRKDGKPPTKTFGQRYFSKSVQKRRSPEVLLKPLAHNISMNSNSSIGSTKPAGDIRKAKRQDKYYEYSSYHALHGPAQRDSESFAYFFPEDYFEGVRMKFPLSWPTPNGLTATKAQEICHQILANSTIGLACKDLLGKLLDEAIDICLLDLQLKDDAAWVRALVALLENECERRVLGSRMGEFPAGNQPSAAWEEILTALRCPALCSGHGRCTELGCQCSEGHGSHDCSTAKKQALAITALENGGLCDVRASSCSSVRVFGRGFQESPTLHCQATRLIVSSLLWAPKILMIQPNFDVFITNDGLQYSNSRVLTLYDTVCQVCQFHPTGLCKLKENTCNIDGFCYGEGESSPTSPCLLCEPNISKFTWSVNENNLPPVFQAPSNQLLTFIGENFVYQLIAVDPEGSAVLFILEAGPRDARLSPAGLLLWKVDSEEMQTFEFTVSDECNAQSRYSIEVAVKPCSCLSGGTCVTNIKYPPGLGEYLCLCPNGFDGEFCQEDIRDCKSNPCGSGTCVENVESYFCKCPPGLGGSTSLSVCISGLTTDLLSYRICLNCLVFGHAARVPHMPSCASRPCFPGVLCFDRKPPYVGYVCGRCPAGLFGNGRICTKLPTPGTCEPPCEHGGTCLPPNTCSCAYGFVGPRCETMVCNRHCHNGGLCVSPDECQCRQGWSSPSCETAVCNPVCLNGGVCVRPNLCSCPSGFYGPQCQRAVCIPPCKNGGRCVRTNVCSCAEGYAGRRCQKTLNTLPHLQADQREEH